MPIFTRGWLATLPMRLPIGNLMAIARVPGGEVSHRSE
jgi:hypothetical protein